MKVLIMGAGAIGQAIGTILSTQPKVKVSLWDKDLTKVPHQVDLSQVASSAKVIFLAIPAMAVREAAQAISGHISPSTIIVAVAKGLEPDTWHSVPTVLSQVLGSKQPVAMLCGPMLADEMKQGLLAAGVIGTPKKSVFNRLQKLCAGTALRLEHHRDIEAVALAGVLKNIYALGAGIGESVLGGDNWRGWYIAQTMAEMSKLLQLLGRNPKVAYTTAGLGDLVATGISPYSRNHQVGLDIGRHGHTTLTSEGLWSLPGLRQLVGEHISQLPYLTAICQVVLDKQPAPSVWSALQ